MAKVKTLFSFRKAKALIRYHFKIEPKQRGAYIVVPDEMKVEITKLLRRKERSLLRSELNDALMEGYLDTVLRWNE
jgi:hypothetical protein